MNIISLAVYVPIYSMNVAVLIFDETKDETKKYLYRHICAHKMGKPFPFRNESINNSIKY